MNTQGTLAAAEQAVAAITERIDAGRLLPGHQLSEVALAADLGVSRNTLREAFRSLQREGLLDHIPYKGVFVHQATAEDVADIFEYRRFVECNALRHADLSTPESKRVVARMQDCVSRAKTAAELGDWATVGTLNNAFHTMVVELVGNSRLSANARQVQALARIVFSTSKDWARTHGPFVAANSEISAAVSRGEQDTAANLLERYLRVAERHCLELITEVN